jgi:hypothetical protein
MKHLKKYEDFQYHSKMEEKYKKPEERLDLHKCYKCKKKSKPDYYYNNSPKEIQRLF